MDRDKLLPAESVWTPDKFKRVPAGLQNERAFEGNGAGGQLAKGRSSAHLSRIVAIRMRAGHLLFSATRCHPARAPMVLLFATVKAT
jgi:hypothetical protein